MLKMLLSVAFDVACPSGATAASTRLSLVVRLVSNVSRMDDDGSG